MSLSKDAKAARAKKLRDKISDTKVILADLEGKLAKLEGREAAPDQKDDLLSALWDAAPDMARTRSSRHKCNIAWHRIPALSRPTVEQAVAALLAWKKDPEWKKDGGQFVPALDRWIRERRWVDPPKETAAPSRARLPVKPPPETSDEAVTDPAEIAALLGTKPRRMNS